MMIYRILKGATFASNFGSPGFAASYLIKTENNNILFDVGHNGLRNVLLNELQRYGLSPKSIDVVILSHDHWDHVMNYPIFYNSKFVIGYTSENERNGDWAYVHFLQEKLKEMDTLYIKKNNTIQLDQIKIISVPGHTEGSIAAVLKDNNETAILTGDTITSTNSFRSGKPDLVFYSEEDSIKSYKRILSFSPTIIFPGHDAPFKIGPIKYLFEKDYIEATLSGNTMLKCTIK